MTNKVDCGFIHRNPRGSFENGFCEGVSLNIGRPIWDVRTILKQHPRESVRNPGHRIQILRIGFDHIKGYSRSDPSRQPVILRSRYDRMKGYPWPNLGRLLAIQRPSDFFPQPRSDDGGAQGASGGAIVGASESDTVATIPPPRDFYTMSKPTRKH
jgi:hypothetical protein